MNAAGIIYYLLYRGNIAADACMLTFSITSQYDKISTHLSSQMSLYEITKNFPYHMLR